MSPGWTMTGATVSGVETAASCARTLSWVIETRPAKSVTTTKAPTIRKDRKVTHQSPIISTYRAYHACKPPWARFTLPVLPRRAKKAKDLPASTVYLYDDVTPETVTKKHTHNTTRNYIALY